MTALDKRATSIGIVHPYFSVKGGAERVAAALIRALSDTGNITVYTMENEGQVAKAIGELEPDFDLNSIQILSYRNLPVKLPILLSYALLLRKLKANPPKSDILISTYGELPTMGQARTFCYIHYPSFAKSLHAAKRIGGRLSTLLLVRSLYVRSCRVIAGFTEIDPRATLICNSAWTQREVEALYKRKSVVVYPPVEPFFYKRELSLVERTSIACLGRLVAYKGHQKLIDAVRALRVNTGMCFTIKFIGRGNGSAVKQLRSRGREIDPIIISNVGRQEIAKALANVRMAVSAFEFEHFGIAVAELISSGIPTFVPPGGGQVEVVPDDYLIYRSEDELVEKLNTLATDDNVYQRLVALSLERRHMFSRNRFDFGIQSVVHS